MCVLLEIMFGINPYIHFIRISVADRGFNLLLLGGGGVTGGRGVENQ